MGRRTPRRETLWENIPILKCIFTKNVIFGLQTTFFDGFNVIMSFLAENDAERSRNYFKKKVLDPKCAKLDQNSDSGEPEPNPKLNLPSQFDSAIHYVVDV